MKRKSFDFQVFTRLLIGANLFGVAVFGSFTNVCAQEAAAGAPIVLIATQRTAGTANSEFSNKFSGENQSRHAWLGFSVLDHVQVNAGSGGLRNLDLVGAYPAFLGPSYDPFKTFDGPNGFATGVVGLAPRPDDLMRQGSAAPDPVWVGLAPDTAQTKRGNNFEASMTAQFVFPARPRYPVTISFPAYVAVQEEEYFFGPSFGYICGGINVRAPLSLIPSRYGRWSAGISADFCYYGTTATEFVKSIGMQVPKLAAAFNVAF